jgi:hypothetical protein
MKMNARSTYAPRSSTGQFIQANITPAITASVMAASQLVFDESQRLVHVRSGELKGSARMVINPTDKTVVGNVVYDSEHAAYNEFGTGRRGAESPEAGPYPYDPNWPGMAPIPYLRPALDTTRQAVLGVFGSMISQGLR